MRELEIYIHIPFCVKKCGYCDFLSAPAKREQRDHYIQTLLEEIRSGAPVSAPPYFSLDSDDHEAVLKIQDYIVTSVYIGGGTPSLLPASQIAEILGALRAHFCFSDHAEISIECNPGTIAFSDRGTVIEMEKEKMEAWRACGVNRVSIGLQSSENAELAALGRIHTFETFLHTFELTGAAGFTNRNVDLMSALPGQSAESWENTLRKVLALCPEHISVYSLIIEEGTPFYEKYHEDDLLRSEGEQPFVLPSEEEERRMYDLTNRMLTEAGYVHYEISNYALNGYECRHNIGYWRGVEYMGFGLGASSYLKYWDAVDFSNRKDQKVGEQRLNRDRSVRCKNPVSHREYEKYVQTRVLPDLNHPDYFQILSAEDEISEFMFLGLRMLSGVSEQVFCDRFGCRIDEIYSNVIERLVKLGLLRRESGRIFLTPRGLDLSNTVMAEFLL